MNSLRDYTIWMGFHILMERLLPCEIVEGGVLPNKEKSRLKYNINGHLQFWISMLAMTHVIPVFKGTVAAINVHLTKLCFNCSE